MHFALSIVFTALLLATGLVAANIPQLSTEAFAALATRADDPGFKHDQVSVRDRSIVDGTDSLKDLNTLSARDYHSPSLSKSRGIHAKVHGVLLQVHRDFLGDHARVVHLLNKEDANHAEKHDAARTFERHLQVNNEKIKALTKDVVAAKHSGLARRQEPDFNVEWGALIDLITTIVEQVFALLRQLLGGSANSASQFTVNIKALARLLAGARSGVGGTAGSGGSSLSTTSA